MFSAPSLQPLAKRMKKGIRNAGSLSGQEVKMLKKSMPMKTLKKVKLKPLIKTLPKRVPMIKRRPLSRTRKFA